uniref:ceramide glucosyltransferase n=1 Tax=Amphimedon queenslandica TaxID=400682 RepID=A0A1X7UH65_AMPQE
MSLPFNATGSPPSPVIAEDPSLVPGSLHWLISKIPLVISLIVLLYYVVYMSVHVLAISYAYFKLHSWKPKHHLVKPDSLPGVTVIKPIIGVDRNMRDNLESFFKLSYPKFELFLCLAESKATPPPSLPIIEELRELYPHLPYVSPNSMETFADFLDKVYFGTQHSRVYLWANLIRRNCATGMSWVIKKSAIEQEGGIKVFSEYLAEDYFIGKALWTRGWTLALSSLPALQNPGSRSLSLFKNRVIRWGRLRATMMPLPVLFEPFTECFVLGFVGSCVIHYLINSTPYQHVLLVSGLHRFIFIFICHTLIWLLCDLLLIRVIENGPVTSLWKVLIVWILRELWALPLFITSSCSREITWRGVRFQLHFGGKATKID